MKVELGATVLLEQRGPWRDIAESPLWHLPNGDDTRAVCGLPGVGFPYRGDSIRQRRCCKVCLARSPARLVADKAEAEWAPDGRGVPRRITDEQLALLYRIYDEQGLSARQIAEQVWEQFGYKNARSCTSVLHGAFKAGGYKLRDRIEATIIASTKHGRAPRHEPRIGYKRFLRESRGEEVGRTCNATTTRGRPCRHLALLGKPYCQSHDPERREATNRKLAEMRARSPRHRPENLTTAAEFHDDLAAYWQAFRSWKPLIAATGISNTELRRYLLMAPEARVLKTTAQRIQQGLSEATDPRTLKSRRDSGETGASPPSVQGPRTEEAPCVPVGRER